ncbi:MAG: Eco57I restriction-modification methylase domain-containing protein [Phycisphaerae bacterium]|nr:Eco57I restriction-modification methylase domain-containing protein [Phycisphaerae bacterium]
MANKAGDPYAQYDRIKDAFRLAEWSEDEFNNRNLFSDYFLKNRLPRKDLFPVFHQDVRPARRELSEVFNRADDTRNLKTDELEDKFVKPLAAALGFETPKRVRGQDAADYLLEAKKNSASANVALLVYPWDRSLDRKDDRDQDRPEDVPGIRVVRALEHHGVSWAILTNGKDWRLYCAAAHSRASNYYEVDLPETLEREDLTAFRYYYLFFRAAAFIPVAPLPDDESGQPACFLDHLRAGSAAFAKEVGDRLRDHIFKDVFPYLAQGFVDYRKKKHGEATRAGDPFLDEVYDATLTLLYRLLFLLYAESLDLLPVQVPAYRPVSLTRLKLEIAKAAGDETDAVEKRLKERFNQTDTTLYRRLGDLFRVIDEGSKDHNVPAYNGGLFETSPQRMDRSREAAAARFLKKHRVPDYFLARALDLLARSEDAKSDALVFVDYKSLGVRQLGNIYEGLLMYHVVIPRDDWEKGFQRKGLRVALVPSNKERKSSGSYFTPQHIVKYIVANTVGPLLTEKFEAIELKLRPIQREYQETREFERKRAEKMRSQPRTDDAIAHSIAIKHEETVWDVFDLKVLDPAMGSGHFLVETVDFITDKVLDFLAGFPWNPVQVLIDQRIRRQIIESLDEQGVKINEDRLTDVNLIKRLVMKRCVYGVDLNPMAVELAKVSLWLDSFTLGAPLSFMDHHLKCGNSLIGATIDDLKKASEGWMYGIPMEPLERATRNMEDIADLTDATVAEVTKSAETYEKVVAGVEGYRALLDCLTAEHFGVKGASHLVTEGSDLDLEHWSKTVESLPGREQGWIKKATKVSRERQFFHWDIDFPDVFFTARREPELRAFDAVIGNPPYIFIIDVPDECREYYAHRWKTVEYRFDVYGIFVELAANVTPDGGRTGFIIPHTLLNNNSFAKLRALLLQECDELALIDFTVPIFEEASNEPMLVFTRKGSYDREQPTKVLGARLADTDLSPSVLRRLPSTVFAQLPGVPFVIPEDPLVGDVIQKCTAGRGRLGNFLEATQGLRTGDNQRFLRPRRLSRGNWRRAVGGQHVGRYEIESVELFVDYDRDALDAPRAEKFWAATDKIVVQEVRNVHLQRRIVAALDNQKTIALNTTNAVILSPGCAYDVVAFLAVMNSSIASEFMRACFRDNHIATQYIYSIPCPDLGQPCEGIDLGASQKTAPQRQDAASVLGRLGRDLSNLGEERNSMFSDLRDGLQLATESKALHSWAGYARLDDLDYLGWQGRYASSRLDDEVAADGRWFKNGVAPPIDGTGPGDIPFDLIARVYPSYPLPGIDHESWEAGAWEELCDLLRKNKSKIGSDRIRADLTGRGAITHPTGPMRKLQETFFKYHRDIRENRAKAAEIDFLIDRIVFRLFDLTLDEQKLILSRVGPGRPLPPRRGRRKKSAGKKKLDPTPTLFD